MRIPVLQAVWPVLFLMMACSDSNRGNGASSESSSEGADDGGSVSTSDDPHAGCDAYLKCVTGAEPDALPEALQAYGPSGTCWSAGPPIASDCDTACATAMSELDQAHPYVASCAGGGNGANAFATPSKDAGTSQVTLSPSFPGLDSTCNACATTACGKTESACYTSSDCESAIECMSACNGDASCKKACSSKAASASSNATLFASCLDAECENDCPGF